MKQKVYSGYITTCSYDFLCLNEQQELCNRDCSWDALADRVSEDWEDNEKVFIRYYIADGPMTLDEATRRLLGKMFGGPIKSDWSLIAYSEYTVCEWIEELEVGGHNIIDELATHHGKYVVLVIESSPDEES